jgi:fucose permease
MEEVSFFQSNHWLGAPMIESRNAQQVTPHVRVPRAHLALAFLAFILIGSNDGALGVLIPSMRVFYQVDNATISWLFFMTVLGYLIATFNNGLLMEHLGERRFLLLGTTIFMLGVGFFSLRPPFALFLCTGTLIGFGIGMIDAGLNAYVASLPDNARLLNYLHAFYGAGALLGPLVASSLLALRFGWQATYLTWLGLALVIFLGLLFAFKHQSKLTKEADKAQGGNALFEALRLRGVWLAAFFLLFYVGTEVSLGNWGYSFLTVARLGPTLFSAWVVSGYWCGLTLGRLFLANLAPRLGVRRLITLCLSGVVLGLLLAWLLPGVWGAAIGFCLTGFSLGPLFPTAIALIPQFVSARLVPSAVGFLACLGSAGAAFFPWLAGTSVQHLGFWFLLPFAFLLTLGMSGLWMVLARQQTSA